MFLPRRLTLIEPTPPSSSQIFTGSGVCVYMKFRIHVPHTPLTTIALIPTQAKLVIEIIEPYSPHAIPTDKATGIRKAGRLLPNIFHRTVCLCVDKPYKYMFPLTHARTPDLSLDPNDSKISNRNHRQKSYASRHAARLLVTRQHKKPRPRRAWRWNG